MVTEGRPQVLEYLAKILSDTLIACTSTNSLVRHDGNARVMPFRVFFTSDSLDQLTGGILDINPPSV